MRTILVKCLHVLALLFATSGAAIAQNVSQVIDPGSGLVQTEISGTSAITIQYVFWGANYQWAGMETKPSVRPDGTRDIKGQSKALGLTMQSQSKLSGGNGGSIDWAFNADRALDGVTGGGLSVRFNLTAFGSLMGDPEMSPDRRGFRWGRAPGPVIEFRLDRAVASAYLEPGSRSEVRILFFSGRIPEGEARWRMTWNVAGAAVETRSAGPANASWPSDPLHLDMPAVDLTRLPGMRRQLPLRRVSTRGSDLIDADGAPLRLWGTNVTAHALFTTPQEEIKRQARRLAALGYNLVRLHHHDSHWVQPNALTGATTVDGRMQLSDAQLAGVDRWVQALRSEGIYIWLDLHVQRAFGASDQIDGFEDIRKGKPAAEAKGFNYVNPSIQSAMRRFAQAYLSRINPLTGLAYKDDPAVLAVLVTNENDVTIHFGNAMLADKGVPWHHKRLQQAAEAYSSRSGLAADPLMRTWEHGPSKYFLNDLEARYLSSEREFIQGLGFGGLVVGGSSWGENPISALPALTTGDLIDVHAYDGEGTLRRDPRYGANLANWVAAAQVVGMPLSVSEWNASPFPTQDRHVLPLYLAAVGSHQGWDALMHYAYTQVPPAPNRASNWHAFNDPSLLATMPAAALLFREKHVRSAQTDYVVDLTADQMTGKAWSPGNSPAMRMAMEHGRLSIAMPQTSRWPWLAHRPAPTNAIALKDLSSAERLPRSGESDTGELKRDWAQGIYLIRTPRTRAALGELGGKDLNLNGVRMRWQTSQLSVAVQSLDGQPVEQSRDILISIGTRSKPQPGGATPFQMEPAAGEIKLPCGEGMRLWSAAEGAAWIAQAMRRSDGICHVVLDGQAPAHWLRLSINRP